MQPKSEGGSRLEPDPHGVHPTAVYSEQWWHNIGYGAISPVVRGGNASNSSSMECPNGSESNDGQSLSNGGLNEEDDGNKEIQTTASSRSGTLHHYSTNIYRQYLLKKCYEYKWLSLYEAFWWAIFFIVS